MSHVTEKNRYHKKSCLSVFLYNTGCLLPQRIKRLSYSSRHIVVVVIFFLVAQTMTFSFLRWLLIQISPTTLSLTIKTSFLSLNKDAIV